MSADTAISSREKDLGPALHDGYEVHKAALARGLDITLLPRQVLMASRRDGSRELSFVHGVPESSSLSAVTFAQDKRIRRALLVDAGLPIPKGGAYSIGRGVDSAKQRLIRRIGYPVVVKPAVGDNITEVQDRVSNEQQLNAAFNYFLTPATERPSFVRAAYALTETRELGEIDGEEVAPPGYRVLVEQRVSGQYLRFVVIGGTVRSVLHCPRGPWGAAEELHRDVTTETHASLIDMAAATARAVPGLAVAAVDIVAAGGYHEPVDSQDVWIVELSERPWLAAQAAVSETLSSQLGDAIVTSYDPAIRLDDPADERAVEVHCEGIGDVSSATPVIEAAGRKAGLSIQLSVTDHVKGVVDGVIQGPPSAIAWLTEMLSDGQLEGCRAMLVDERVRMGGVGHGPQHG